MSNEENNNNNSNMPMFDENWFVAAVCRQALKFLAEVKEQKVDEVTLGFKAFEMFGAFLNRDIMLDYDELTEFYAKALIKNRQQRQKLLECEEADFERLHVNGYGTGKIAPSFEQ